VLLRKNVLNRQRRWRTLSELAYEIVVWIEHTYNRRRRQRALGGLTPVVLEPAFILPPCLEDDEQAACHSQPSTERAKTLQPLLGMHEAQVLAEFLQECLEPDHSIRGAGSTQCVFVSKTWTDLDFRVRRVESRLRCTDRFRLMCNACSFSWRVLTSS
jgi:hypothetical protein